jgi:hypothetical protein
MASATPAGGVAWLAATAAAVVLTATVLAAWGRGRPAVRVHAILGVVCAALGGALVLLLVAPSDVPTGWITVLQEGRSARNIRQLYGWGTHAGPGFAAFVEGVSRHGPATLPAVVRVNLALGVVNTIVLFVLAHSVLRSWWASVAFAAAYACNLNTIQAAFSETPAMLWTTHVWVACIAAAAVADRGASRPLRGLALACFAWVAVLATSIRPEALLLAVPAVVIGLAHVAGAEATLQRALWSVGRLLRTIVTGPLAVFLVASAALLALEFVPIPADWRYPVAGLRPLNFAFLTFLQAITLFFPFAIVVLFVLGLVHGVRRWLTFFLLPISLLVVLKVYAAGSHGAFLDKFRYLTFVTPFVLFLALFGFRELSLWAERLAWPAWWRRVAVLLLVATVPAWNPWQREFFGRRQELPGVATTGAFLARNQQTEVRYLLDLVARYPRCVFVAKTPRADSASDPKKGYRWSAFGAGVPRLVEREDASGSAGPLDRVASDLAPDAPCVLFYRSKDCDLVGFEGCGAETEGRVALEERVLENVPYSEIYEYGAHRPEIRLGIYPVIVRDRSALASAADASR